MGLKAYIYFKNSVCLLKFDLHVANVAATTQDIPPVLSAASVLKATLSNGLLCGIQVHFNAEFSAEDQHGYYDDPMIWRA